MTDDLTFDLPTIDDDTDEVSLRADDDTGEVSLRADDDTGEVAFPSDERTDSGARTAA